MARQPRQFELALRRRVVPYADVARNLINEAVEDAVAHASQLVPQMTGEGRDYSLLASSGLLEAANRRLSRLAGALLDLVRRSRVEFYINSHELHHPHLHPDHHVMDVKPSHEGAMAVADAPISGRNLQAEVLTALERTKFMLKSSLLQVGLNPTRGEAIMNGWRATAADQLQAKVEQLLNDGSHAIHDALSWALIKDELRPKI